MIVFILGVALIYTANAPDVLYSLQSKHRKKKHTHNRTLRASHHRTQQYTPGSGRVLKPSFRPAAHNLFRTGASEQLEEIRAGARTISIGDGFTTYTMQ